MRAKKAMSRRDFLRLSAGLAAGAVAAACAPAAPQVVEVEKEVPVEKVVKETVVVEKVVAPEKATVTVWAWPGFVDPIRGLVPEFNEKHPDIKIKFQQMSWGDVHKKLITALAAGTGAPDIAAVSDYKIGDLAGEGGGLADITDWMKPYEKDFLALSWAELQKDGKIWAVPSDASPVVVYYRKDKFDEWDLDLEEVELWDDFIAMGQEVVDKSGGKSHLMALQPGLVGVHQNLAGQLGSAIFNRDNEVIVNDEGNLKALRLIKKLIDSETAAPNVTDAAWNAGLKDGSFATYIMPAWFVFPMKKQAPETAGKWRVMKLPAYTAGGSRATDAGGADLAITEQSKNKEAAWTYLEFTQCTKEGQLKQFLNFDLFPTFKPALEDPAFDEPVPFFGGQPMRRMLAEVAEDAPPIWRGANYMEARDILNLELVAAAEGKKSPEEALADAEAAIKSKIGGA